MRMMWNLLGFVLEACYFAFYVVLWTAALMLLLLGFGCSASEQIAARVGEVQQRATEIRGDVAGARQALQANDAPGVEAKLNSIDAHAGAISKATVYVQTKLTQVEDSVPFWAQLVKWGLIVVVLLAVVFLLWRFDVFLILEKVIQKIADVAARVFARGVGA